MFVFIGALITLFLVLIMVCIVIQLICHKRKRSYRDICANIEFQVSGETEGVARRLNSGQKVENFNIDFLEELDRDLETANASIERNLVGDNQKISSFFEQVELPKRDYFCNL